MHRDPALVPLSHDHQHALALAHRLRRAPEDGSADAELREQAVAALANDYCPPHLEADKKAMQAAIRADRNTAGPICEAHFAERWKWAREIAPSLPVVRK